MKTNSKKLLLPVIMFVVIAVVAVVIVNVRAAEQGGKAGDKNPQSAETTKLTEDVIEPSQDEEETDDVQTAENTEVVEKSDTVESDDNIEAEYMLKPGVYKIEGYQSIEELENPFKTYGFAIDEYGNMSAGWSHMSSHMILGYYTIEDDVLCLYDEGDGSCYKYRIIDDSTVAVILDESSGYQVTADDYKIQDGDIFTFVEECGGPLYCDKDGNPISRWNQED